MIHDLSISNRKKIILLRIKDLCSILYVIIDILAFCDTFAWSIRRIFIEFAIIPFDKSGMSTRQVWIIFLFLWILIVPYILLEVFFYVNTRWFHFLTVMYNNSLNMILLIFCVLNLYLRIPV